MRISALLLSSAFGVASTVSAGGLVDRLPPDAHYAQFEMNETIDLGGGKKQELKGTTIIISSVGRKDVQGKPHRWLEVKMTTPPTDGKKQFSSLFKLLVAEDQFMEGGNPLGKVAEAWQRRGDGEARPITDLDRRLGLWFGPGKDHKPLPKKVLVTAFGKLDCAGRQSKYTAVDPPKERHEFTRQAWRHERAPFGVIALDVAWQSFRDDQIQASGTMTVRLVKAGKGAKSELPVGEQASGVSPVLSTHSPPTTCSFPLPVIL